MKATRHISIRSEGTSLNVYVDNKYFCFIEELLTGTISYEPDKANQLSAKEESAVWCLVYDHYISTQRRNEARDRENEAKFFQM